MVSYPFHLLHLYLFLFFFLLSSFVSIYERKKETKGIEISYDI